MSTRKRLIANSTSGLVARFANLCVQVWLFQYLIKRISPQEYSLYPVVAALLVFVPPLLVVLSAGLSRDAVEAHARNEDQRVTEITSTMFPVLFTSALVLTLLALAVARYLGFILNIAPENLFEARLMVLLMFGGLALRVALLPFSTGLYICQKFVVINTLTVSQTIIRVALLFVLLLGEGPRVLWVVVASVAADVVIVLVTVVLSIRTLPALRFRFGAIRWELLSGLMAFGFWNMVGSIGGMIRRSSDVLILNWFATPIDVNTFQLASLTDNQIDAALLKVEEPLLPHMVTLHTKGGPPALQKLFVRVSRYNLWASLLVATPLIVFRQQLWSLYLGSKFEVYTTVPLVMMLLLARYWVDMPAYLIGQVAYAMNRMKELSILTMATALGNVAITVYLVHVLRMGAVGSALGTLISVMICDFFVAWKFSLHLLGLEFRPWFKAVVWRGVLPSAVAGLFGLGWQHWVRPESIAKLVLAVGLVASVYVLSILLFCLDHVEWSELKQLMAKLSSQRVYKVLASRIDL